MLNHPEDESKMLWTTWTALPTLLSYWVVKCACQSFVNIKKFFSRKIPHCERRPPPPLGKQSRAAAIHPSLRTPCSNSNNLL